MGGGGLIFVFHYKRWGGQDGRPLAQVTLWMMCMERCLVQLSTLHSKRPFSNPRVSHLRAGTLLPPSPHPSPTPATESQLLPAPASPGPGPRASCGQTGVGWRWTPGPCPQKTLVCQRDESVLVLAGRSRAAEGFSSFHVFGGGWVDPLPPPPPPPHGRGGNKSSGALSHAPVLACAHL